MIHIYIYIFVLFALQLLIFSRFFFCAVARARGASSLAGCRLGFPLVAAGTPAKGTLTCTGIEDEI